MFPSIYDELVEYLPELTREVFAAAPLLVPFLFDLLKE